MSWWWLSLAFAGSKSGVSLEVGPTGPTVAPRFGVDEAWGVSMSMTAVAYPASLAAWGRREASFPVPAPGLSVLATHTAPLGSAQRRLGVGYNMGALHASILASVSDEGRRIPTILLAALEGEAQVLIPALGPRTHLVVGLRPRGYGVLAATWLATADDPAVAWTFLGPTIGFQLSE